MMPESWTLMDTPRSSCPNIDVLKKLVEDDFFSESATPDEEALMDMDSVMRTIGYEEIHVENGRVV